MYVIHNKSFDIKDADLFSAIVDQYFEMVQPYRIETKDLTDFMRRFKTCFPTPSQFENEVSIYRMDKYPQLRQPEPEKEPNENERRFGVGLCRIMMQQFQQPTYDGDKELLRAVMIVDYYEKWDKPIPDIYRKRMLSDELVNARQYLKTYKPHHPFKQVREGMRIVSKGGEKIELPEPKQN